MWIEYQAGDGEARGYLALPAKGEGPGVLVLHAWWGLNDFFQGFCERLAGEGFVALAPDLYHGETAATIEQAKSLMSRVKRAVASQEITAGVETLRSQPVVKGDRLGLVGFSMGAYWGMWLAEELPAALSAVVVFYGKKPGEFTTSSAAFLGHFAEHDEFESLTAVRRVEKQLQKAGRPVNFYIYPETRHWFFEADWPEAFDQAAAELAWKRTIEFLQEYL